MRGTSSNSRPSLWRRWKYESAPLWALELRWSERGEGWKVPEHEDLGVGFEEDFEAFGFGYDALVELHPVDRRRWWYGECALQKIKEEWLQSGCKHLIRLKSKRRVVLAQELQESGLVCDYLTINSAMYAILPATTRTILLLERGLHLMCRQTQSLIRLLCSM